MSEGLKSIRSAELDLEKDLLRYPDLVFVLNYWRKLKGDRIAPSRQDVEPTDIKRILPRILIADVLPGDIDPYEFRYRLIGTGVCKTHADDLTGKGPRDLRPDEFGEMIQQHYLECMKRQAPIAHSIAFVTDELIGAYARIIVPLSSDGESINMLMAVDSRQQNSLHEALEEIDALGKQRGTEL